MYTFLRQRRLRWLGHTHRMADGRIPKDLFMVNSQQGQEVEVDLNFDSRMSASVT